MSYNERKLELLRIISKLGTIDSESLADKIDGLGASRLDIHALRMALMRYHRQGLLKRERLGGTYRYRVTERGLQRLRWLEDQTMK